MDLLDLYHAHDHSLAFEEDPEEIPSIVNTTQKKTVRRQKEAKFLPWEPYKAAPSHDRKGEAPTSVPPLIPYTSQSASLKPESNSETYVQLVDQLKIKKKDNNQNTVFVDSEYSKLKEEISRLSTELEAERAVNRELKSIFLKSLGDDFQCEVEALAGDKVQLGRRLEDYCEKVVVLTQQLEDARIEADVWKCKFHGQSIRYDDISRKLGAAVSLLHHGQSILSSFGESLPSELHELATFETQKLLNRSPCDPRVIRKLPNFSNITITCCKNCSGREIVLL